MTSFSCIVIGDESLAVQCAGMLLERGHRIAGLVSGNPEVRAWAEAATLRVEDPGAGLADRLGQLDVDWVLSIANLAVIPEAVLAKAGRGAINFHDGPLPRYAGLNAPVWALLNREVRHGVTWHMIEGGIDEGDIVEQRLFDLDPGETALTLNTKCYGAAIDSFGALLASLEDGGPNRVAQALDHRTYFGRWERPAAAAGLDFRNDAGDVVALVRALDFGRYWNPLACAKIDTGSAILLVGEASVAPGHADAAAGTVLEVTDQHLVVATGSGAVALGRLTDISGAPVPLASVPVAGAILPSLDEAAAEALTRAMARVARAESHWRKYLADLAPARLPLSTPPSTASEAVQLPIALPAGLQDERVLAAAGAWASRIGGEARLDLAYTDADIAGLAPGYASDWIPVRFEADTSVGEAMQAFSTKLAQARQHGPFALDLPARDPAIKTIAVPDVAIARGSRAVAGACLTVCVDAGGASALFDPARLSADAAEALIGSLGAVLQAVADGTADDLPVESLPLTTAAERVHLVEGWNPPATAYDDRCMHAMFEAQAARTPDATAVVFEAEALTYADLDIRANRVAQVLRTLGVSPDTLVGLHMPRSVEMVVGALAIHKAGGAYVPLDPGYPADRIAHYLEDSAASIVLTRSDVAGRLPHGSASLLLIDADPRIAAAPSLPVQSTVAPENLAYVIYTSGSTGKPKGVMIEHRNVANFYAGMDERIGGAEPGVWLAVTSLSFDISVLELFWSLARGFTVVLSGDESRTLVSSGRPVVSQRPVDFSLFYWGNDDGVGRGKYELLLEGAKFADAHGFAAVWTPERHFHAFGGPYPNPSVTGAAVAAVTRNLSVRAGSCVAPLHHVARIAEEWAVIDNLTGGRAGLAIASGWQPDDFVLRPENTPPANKAAMYEAIDQLRRLWRGEAVEFPTASGAPFAVVTQPRPVSAEVPVWVTTAGNPETWKEAGALGANVLTHLLGQTIEEVADKIVLYHAALRAAGHDPDEHKVTLMLHTFVGEDREVVRETAREPMKDYLRSAAALIKQYAWAFPAFKKPAGVSNPMQLDLSTLSEEEMEGVLEFAFRRYFEDSGLFGTVEDCVARVESLKRIGVDEIACLIDYGIPTARVLEGLPPLAEVLARANAPTVLADDDFSIAAQIVRHGVTHLQCTPSMARMLTMNDEARAALGRVRKLMIGGEPLPGSLVAEIEGITRARIENMYGPTETTIWSSTGPASSKEAVVNIGTPIANTRLYILDETLEPVPVGVPGELFIAGDGVARGYWQRPELSSERFLPDAFGRNGSMYRTGDLVRRQADGRIEFLGRTDNQVKIRGHRIELGEIEAALEAVTGVRQAVVVAREDPPLERRLVGYVVLAAPVPEADLVRALRGTLPEVMVPSQIVVLDAFPLTPNKKVDRRALPAPAALESRSRSAGAPPSSETERRLAEIWSRILGVSEIGPRDNFFALGGHSLLAVQAHRDIRRDLAPTFGVTDIFRFPTLGALAAYIDGAAAPKATASTDAAADRNQAMSDLMERRRMMRGGRQQAS